LFSSELIVVWMSLSTISIRSRIDSASNSWESVMCSAVNTSSTRRINRGSSAIEVSNSLAIELHQ
jgi:hypothetical protein